VDSFAHVFQTRAPIRNPECLPREPIREAGVSGEQPEAADSISSFRAELEDKRRKLVSVKRSRGGWLPEINLIERRNLAQAFVPAAVSDGDRAPHGLSREVLIGSLQATTFSIQVEDSMKRPECGSTVGSHDGMDFKQLLST